MAVDTSLTEKLNKLEGKRNQTLTKGFLSGAPYVTTGKLGTQGYSVLKAVGYALGYLDASQAKEEIETNRRLKEIYSAYGSNWGYQGKSFLIPQGSDLILDAIETSDDRNKAFVGELRQKMAYSLPKEVDQDYANRVTKTLGTFPESAGGNLVQPAQLGEIIDLQRNREAFSNAGANNTALPPNGRISFPRLTGASTTYAVGEGNAITESEQTFGNLDLVAKKYATLTKINAELFRFANPSAEAIIRNDMALSGALKVDADMLTGTGGTSIKGLLTYSGITTHTASTAGANGNTFQPEDVGLMEGKLPDAVDAPTAWLMRRLMFAAIRNRRADAVSASDGKGPFVFDITRSAADGMSDLLYGTKVVKTNQVANNRVKGSGTNLSYILLGYFPDWVIARFGVLEIMANPYGQTDFANDIVALRSIQHIDAGARQPASFVLCDELLVA